MKKPSPVERLVAAMRIAAGAQGQAQWTNGYRAGRPDKEAALHEREMTEWDAVEKAEVAFERVCKQVLRDARKAKRRTVNSGASLNE